MGNTVQQWRSSIGRWCGGTPCIDLALSYSDASDEHHGSSASNLEYFILGVVLVLLLIAGIEMNPGPLNNEQYSELEKSLRQAMEQKLAQMRRDLEQKMEQEKLRMEQDLWRQLQHEKIGSDIELSTGNFQPDRHGYEKATGTANMTGELYEIKMLTLLFLRGLRESLDFHITSNMKAAKGFDDIVFTLRGRTVFIQLKHRENTKKEIEKRDLIKDKGKLSLIQYYRSYCKIKEDWAQNKDLQYCGRFEDTLFIVYTNAVMSEDAEGNPGNTDWMGVLNTKGKCFYFKDDSYPLKETQDVENLADYGKFLTQFLFFTEQAAEDELDDFIRQEVKNVCGTEAAYFQLEVYVQNWWRSPNGYHLTSKTQFWRDIIDLSVNNISQEILEQFNKLPITFHKHNFVPPIGSLLHVETNGTTEILTCLKLHQILGHEPHLLVYGSTIQDLQNEELPLWGRWCDLLVVVDDRNTPTNFIRSHQGKRLIYISSSEPECKCQKWRDEPNLSQLDETSKTKVLDSKVFFQDHEVPLKTLIMDSNHELVAADVIVQLLMDKVVLGEALTGDLDYYIPRTLQLADHVRQDILSHTTTDAPVMFAVSGLSESKLQQLVPPHREICTMDTQENKCKVEVISTEDDFLRLAESNKTIHWLHWESNILKWKQSKWDMSVVLKYLKQETSFFENVDSVADIDHHVALVSADPGMGKSTLLTHLALRTKKAYPNMWVIEVNLNDFTQQLDNLPENIEIKDVVQFLLEVSGVKEVWKPLLKFMLMSMKNICVLFDGYDEISPTHADKVASILKLLQETKLKKLWVTTRPVMRQKLEQELCVLSLTLQPFSEKNQITFLEKFWKSRVHHIEDTRLIQFIEELLQLTARNLNDIKNKFTCLPLQSMLLAEAFEEDLRAYCENGEKRLCQKFDLFQLYNKFVDRKLRIYWDKNKMDLTKQAVKEGYNKMKKEFQQNHMISALIVLLHPDDTAKLLASEHTNKLSLFVQEIKEGKENTGIINQIVKEKPVFIHRTFAEYFAALWFADNFDGVIDYLKENLFDPNFKIVRIFFDRMLAQNSDLLSAVLNQNEVSVQNLLSQKELDVNTQDKGGRTALHLAIMNHLDSHEDEHNINIIRILLERGADTTIMDKILCLKPLSLAEKVRDWSAIDLLLETNADHHDLNLIRENSSNDNYIQDGLKTASRRGLTHLVKFMLRCGVQVGHPISVTRGLFGKPECRATMLHEAAEHGCLEFVKVLVANKADIEALDDEYKRTALMWAAERGELEVVKFLRQKGASISTHDKWGNTPLKLAIQNGKLNVITFLIEDHGMPEDDCNVLHCAAESGNVDVVTCLLELKIPVDCHNDYQETPLWRAAWFGQLEVLKLLHQRDADLEVHCSKCSQFSELKYTPLHAAVRGGHLHVVQYLVEQGVDLTAKDHWGRTPLDVALWFKGHSDVAKYLSDI